MILEQPINFIKENLTGWTLIFFIILVIYFIGLRSYYIQKETFYHHQSSKKNNVTNKSKTITKTKELKIKEKFTTQEQHTNILDSVISTTLFDNLNLSQLQLEQCNNKYNDIIAQLIVDLTNLVQKQEVNRFLDSKKQFTLLITKNVDNIINFLNNDIKSYNKLTRTNIKNDIITTLNNVLELLISRTTSNISNKTSNIANQDSTTIDYKTQLNELTQLRTQLDEYYKILNLISNNLDIPNPEKVFIPDKSFLLPIYEQNYNKIYQMINSDFNGDENKLAEKYSKVYNDILEKEKKEQLNVNPLVLASQIESGIISMLENTTTPIIEQYNTSSNTSSFNTITNNPSNRGTYLLDNDTQKQLIEGFKTDKSTSDTGIMNNLISGNFIQYIMDMINTKIQWIYNNTNAYYNKNANFNLEENMIPAGFLLFILSMLIYFIDVTS